MILKDFIKNKIKDKKLIAIGLLILAVGLLLRLYNLTIIPVFADEAIYIRWSQIMFNEATLRFLPLSDGKQPLFMWVLMYLVHRFNNPLFIGRLVSVATGIGTIAGIFALTQLLFKNIKASLLASVFWAISPFAVFYDRVALVDSMLAMFGVCTLFWGVLAAKTKRLDVAMLTGFALGFALLTKSPAIFFALLLPPTWFVFNKLKKIYLLAPTYIIAFGMYSIQRLGPNFHLLSQRTADYVFPLSQLWTNPKDPFIFHLRDIGLWLGSMGPALIIGLALIGVVLLWKKYPKEVLVLGLWSLGPLLAQSMYAKVFTARYILFTLPPLFIVASGVIQTKKQIIQKLAVVLLVIFAFQALWFDFLLLTNPKKAPLPRRVRSGFFEEWTSGTGIYEISTFVREELRKKPETNILVGTEGYFGTLPDGLQMFLEGVSGQTVVGVGLVFEEVPTALTDAVKAGNKVYFVVNSDRLKLKPEEKGLKLIASYPKEMRKEGTREYVVGGPQQTLYLFEVSHD